MLWRGLDPSKLIGSWHGMDCYLALHLQLTPKTIPRIQTDHLSMRGDSNPPGRGRNGQQGTWLMATYGEDSLRETRAPRGRVSVSQVPGRPHGGESSQEQWE